jgi:uncharacterized protein (DUF433 family)
MNKLSKQQNSVSIVSTLPNTNSKEIKIYNAYVTDKRLKDFSTKEDLLLINSLIVRWATYVGVDTPEASQINMLANFIKEHFPTFNAYDIKECIGLLASQSLETDAEHYGKISPIYVSKVLKSYQEYKNNAVFKVRENIEKLKEAEVAPMPNEERIANFKKLLTIAKGEFLQGLTYIDSGDSIYNFVKHNKLFPLSKELITEAMEYGGKLYIEQRKKKVTETVIKNQSFKRVSDMQFEKEDMIKKYAREFVVNKFLMQLELNELLQKINIEMLKY